MNAPTQTIADLIRPYRASAVAEAVGVTGDTVRLWRSGKSSPATDKVPALARFLRVDVSIVLNAIIAQREAAA